MISGRHSVGQEVAGAAKLLEHAGIVNPRREATAIWASVAGVQMGDVWLHREGPALPSRAHRFRAAVDRRAEGEPFPYAVGTAGFRTLDLLVDRRVVIPRPETEGLVDRVLTWGRARQAAGAWGTAADVGTGSGCIALSLALEARFDRVIATDVSQPALEVAAANLRRHDPPTPVELRAGSLLEPLEPGSLEVLVSNPPYVSPVEYDRLDPGVRDYEPREGLVSGGGGMDHTRALLVGAAQVLVPGGLLVLEVDSERAHWTLKLAREAGWRNAVVEPDLFGCSRYLVATKESQ